MQRASAVTTSTDMFDIWDYWTFCCGLFVRSGIRPETLAINPGQQAICGRDFKFWFGFYAGLFPHGGDPNLVHTVHFK